MPFGYLIGILIQGALVALTLTAPRRPRLLAVLAYRVASAYNEAPFVFIHLIVISSIGPVMGGGLARQVVGSRSVWACSWSSVS